MMPAPPTPAPPLPLAPARKKHRAKLVLGFLAATVLAPAAVVAVRMTFWSSPVPSTASGADHTPPGQSVNEPAVLNRPTDKNSQMAEQAPTAPPPPRRKPSEDKDESTESNQDSGKQRPDEPAKELTDDERINLQKEVFELGVKAFDLFQHGQHADAIRLLEKSLDACKRLYPTDKYPDGHPDLVANLTALGFVAQYGGDYAKGERYASDALEMCQRLYPVKKYPNGHPDLATSLTRLGLLVQARGEYARAEGYLRDALVMRKRLYSEDKLPNGQFEVAHSLDNLGFLLIQKGEYSRGEGYLREAVEVFRRLYPADHYTAGSPDLAMSINHLGRLLYERGDYGKAEPYLLEALEMRKRLYPGGHPDLLASLAIVGELLYDRGDYPKAAGCLRESLEICRRVYPAERYPDGHPYIASILCNLGVLLSHLGENAKAEEYCRGAACDAPRIYAAEQYPDGHPDVASNLNILGHMLHDRGEYSQAEPFCRDALAMRQRLYPTNKYPDGHPELALSLSNLGNLLYSQGKYDKAAEASGKGLAMYGRLTAAVTDAAAEAEVLNFSASLPPARNAYLAAAAHADSIDPADQYALLWSGKSMLARVQQHRRRLLRLAAEADTDVRAKLQQLIAARQDLARLMLAPASPRGPSDREIMLKDLTDRKEQPGVQPGSNPTPFGAAGTVIRRTSHPSPPTTPHSSTSTATSIGIRKRAKMTAAITPPLSSERGSRFVGSSWPTGPASRRIWRPGGGLSPVASGARPSPMRTVASYATMERATGTPPAVSATASGSPSPSC